MSESKQEIVTYPEVEGLSLSDQDIKEVVESVKDKLETSTAMPRRSDLSPEQKMEILAKEAARIEAMSEEERTLEKRKQFNAYMAEMDRIWSQLPRWKKRKIMNPKMKFSSRIKRVLKNT